MTAPTRSSHRLFWAAYYSAVAGLGNWLPPQGSLSVTPVSSSESWFIDLRNRVNYRPFEAFKLYQDFDHNFDAKKIPVCFPGELNSAYQVATSFMFTLKELSQHTTLNTDIYLPNRARKSAIKQHVNGPKNRDIAAFAKRVKAMVEF